MKHGNTARITWQILILVIGISLPHFLTAASSLATRKADEDVRSPSVRMRAGLMPSQNLLFNGWGVTPGGRTRCRSATWRSSWWFRRTRKVLAGRERRFQRHRPDACSIWRAERVTQFLPLPKSLERPGVQQGWPPHFCVGRRSGMIHVFNVRRRQGDSGRLGQARAGGAGHGVWPASPFIPRPASSTSATRAITRSGCSTPTRSRSKRKSAWASIRTLASSARTSGISTSATGAAAASAWWIPKPTAACATSRSACGPTT